MDTSEENLEVAELGTESEENQEVAELDNEDFETEDTENVETVEETENAANDNTETRRTEQDSAFAQMRRDKEELEKQLSDFKTKQAEEQLRTIAEEKGLDAEELIENYRETEKEEQDKAALQQEFEKTQKRLKELEFDNVVREDLAIIQKTFPDVKSIDDLGKQFINMRASGVDATLAAEVCMKSNADNKRTAPVKFGEIGTSKSQKEYYTSEELDNMTPEQISKNLPKVMASMERL